MPRRDKYPVIRERRWLQLAFLAGVALMGAQFALWAFALLGGRQAAVARPAGVEGFLPISALMSLRLWLAGAGIHPVHPAGLAILVAVLVSSAVLAKSFCSHLCPVGTISELLGRLGQRLLGRTWQLPRWLDVPLRGLKYILLLLFVWATWVALDIAGVRAFLDSPYNRVADVKMLLFFAKASRVTIAVLGCLVVGSVLVRDLWCRYLCPYGALLGILGRFAPLKVTRDPDSCTDCRKCTKVCPARLPVHTMGRVASVECSSCQDCVAACPVEGCLAVRSPRLRPRSSPLRLAMRPVRAVAIALAAYAIVVFGFRLVGHWRSVVGEAEYTRRLQEIESPIYTHVGGLAARDDEQATPTAPRTNGAD